MGPGIDHVVLSEVAKVGQDYLGEVSLPNANLGGTLQRDCSEKAYPKVESRRRSSDQWRNIRRGERNRHTEVQPTKDAEYAKSEDRSQRSGWSENGQRLGVSLGLQDTTIITLK